MKVFLGLFIVTFLLRIFYAAYLFEDDGLWFTSAEEILRGKVLYREIVFDKPPVLPLVYALLIRSFGAHIITIRLFTIFYSLAISGVIYVFGAYLNGKRAGLIAAAMFTVFSTTYIRGMQNLSTDFLMVLPYTAGAYLLIRSCATVLGRSQRASARLAAFAGGSLIGLAFQTNQKGAFDLIWFAVVLMVAGMWGRRDIELSVSCGPAVNSGSPAPARPPTSAWRIFGLAFAGFVVVSSTFLLYVAQTRSLSKYWLYVWDWGFGYAGYYPVSKLVKGMLYHGLGYLAVNITLLTTLIFVIIVTTRQAYLMVRAGILSNPEVGQASGLPTTEYQLFKSDTAMLLWFGISFIGVIGGGRFYGHYYYQILPSLCLIGSRGLLGIIFSLRTKPRFLRQTLFTLLAVGFLFTFVRFHSRTAILAAHWIAGNRSIRIGSWMEGIVNFEDRVMAATVRDIPDPVEAVEQSGIEGIRAEGPRARAIQGPADYLFIWGYRPEIYFYSGLIPATRYLSAQPLTGVPADAPYTGNESRPILKDEITSRARVELVEDLEQTQPKYIIDVLEIHNRALAITEYPELRDLISRYKRVQSIDGLIVYVRKDLRKTQRAK